MNESARPLIAWRPVYLVLIVLAGLAAYASSFSGAFILDDYYHIIHNLNIRKLWPIWESMQGLKGTVSARPLLNLTFAVNYAISGLEVWSYHALNLLIHLASGLTLFGILRRTLTQKRFDGRYEISAPWIAFATALLWTVHPLQTQSVTYIVQRGESLMGLFYFLSLYCVIRGSETRKNSKWYWAAVVCCWVGAFTKIVIATAPLVIFIYDRLFLAKSFPALFKRRSSLYFGLFSSWLVVLWSVSLPSHFSAAPSAGFEYKDVSPWEYLRSQAGVLVYYLRLSFWPHPLVVDYKWEVAEKFREYLPQGLLMTGLFIATAASLFRGKPAAFAGVWFFLILAPTSSIVPIADLAVEHRMYLPLAVVIALTVITFYEGTRKLNRSGAAVISLIIVVGIAGTFSYLTFQRNKDYESEITIWKDTVDKRPNNARVHNGLGVALDKVGRYSEAAEYYKRSLELNPDSSSTHNNLAVSLLHQNQLEEALKHAQISLSLSANVEQAHYTMGSILGKMERYDEAIRHFAEALRIRPLYADAHGEWGTALAMQQRWTEALKHYKKAIAIEPTNAKFYNNWGTMLAKQGRHEEALVQFQKALEYDPGYAQAVNNFGGSLSYLGRYDEAISYFKRTLELDPHHKSAQKNLGIVLQKKAQIEARVPS